MTRYLTSRLAGMVVVMMLVATLVFFITRLAPGDPAAIMPGDRRRYREAARIVWPRQAAAGAIRLLGG